MERLTEWIEGGRAIPRMDLRRNGHDRCTQKLAQYEDLGMEPWEIEQYIRAAGKADAPAGAEKGKGKYTDEEIIDAIVQAGEGIAWAIMRQDREMLEDVLKQYLDKDNGEQGRKGSRAGKEKGWKR